MDSDRGPTVFAEELEEKCDQLAEQLLAGIKKKRQLPEFNCIEYTENGSGNSLFICEDGSVLYGPKEVGRGLSLKAFQNGIRSNPHMLAQRFQESDIKNVE